MSPQLSAFEARVVAERLADYLSHLGASVTSLHLESIPAGLLVVATLSGQRVACVVPPFQVVSWEAVARALVDQVPMPESGYIPECPVSLATHEGAVR